MSWTRLGYPSAFACEGDPLHGGFPGDFDPYIHGDKDVIDIDDDRGVFSFNVSQSPGRSKVQSARLESIVKAMGQS